MLALPLPLNQQVRAMKVGATSSGATGFIQFRESKNEDAQKVFVGDFFSFLSSNPDLRFDMG